MKKYILICCTVFALLFCSCASPFDESRTPQPDISRTDAAAHNGANGTGAADTTAISEVSTLVIDFGSVSYAFGAKDFEDLMDHSDCIACVKIKEITYQQKHESGMILWEIASADVLKTYKGDPTDVIYLHYWFDSPMTPGETVLLFMETQPDDDTAYNHYVPLSGPLGMVRVDTDEKTLRPHRPDILNEDFTAWMSGDDMFGDYDILN